MRDGLDLAHSHETSLVVRLIEGLLEIPGLRIHGIKDPAAFVRRVPTVSFTLSGHDPARIAKSLGRANIFVWHGHAYAAEPINAFGLNDSGGVVRIGIAHYNTMREIDACLDVLRDYCRWLVC
ncbi:MAG: aminotransferase class V-fold PLP-dependent enzyme [Gemmatimonadetes bacterium]|nr:aminotransferase class V-fold PLP-dependent enzyme [Gemmatimonadota bacterium]